jgi:hypothetical protein
MRLRGCALLTVAGGLALSIVGVSAGLAGAAGPHVCSGTLTKPGLLKGTYARGVVVKGACAVKGGRARVIGTLTVSKTAVLLAAYGLHHASLTVKGDLVVDEGAAVILGCKHDATGTGLVCLDDPNPKSPTLASHETVSGNIVEHSPLGVVVHNSTIGGSVTETGGGGGLSCEESKTGAFALIKNPVYSTYEDSTIGGNLAIRGLKSCWLGVARVTIGGSLTVSENDMDDPDAIEIVANEIDKNLVCEGNSHPSPGPPDDYPVWDTSDEPPEFSLYPRAPGPNTVRGTRSGQCVSATPRAEGVPAPVEAF